MRDLAPEGALTIQAVGVESADIVFRVMQEAFEEHRGLEPPSGALRESLDDVRAAIAEGGAFLAHVNGALAGCARYGVLRDHLYAGRVGVLAAYRGCGVAHALMAAIEALASARNLGEVRVNVRATLPSNLRFYENLGYRAVASRRYPEGTDFSITLAKALACNSS